MAPIRRKRLSSTLECLHPQIDGAKVDVTSGSRGVQSLGYTMDTALFTGKKSRVETRPDWERQ